MRRTPHPSDRRTILARLTPKGLQTAVTASSALAEIGFGLSGISDVIAARVTADLRKVREMLGDVS